AYRVLTEQLRTATLEGFGCEHMKLATRAGGGLMQYIVDTQKTALSHITKVSAYRHQRHLPIDQATRKALEVTETYRGGDRSGTLISCLDRTASSMGARLLREWVLAPLTDVDDIVRRQEVVAEFVTDDDLRSQTIDLLRHVHDLERLSARISYRSANGRDLVALKNSLTIVPKIRVLLEKSPTRYVAEILSQLGVPSELVDQLEAALVDEPPLAVKEGGVIREGYSPELDETREIASEGTRWIARFQQREIKETGIPSLKVSYNKVFGYYIEVTNTHQDKIPEHYIRKQTLKNCERFLTAELKEYESKVLNAKDRAVELEYEIFCGIRDRAMEHIPTFQRIAAATAQLDVLVTFARIARERDYVRPAINDSARLRIVDGRHPIVEHFQGAEGFVPNSVELDDENRIMMITGPNMAGKSTYIRQVAVLTLMAQTGCFIPAREAELGVVDRIFTRVGAADDLAKGQSTFMVEMHETANILNNATPRSLVVLDEVGRGTSTYDGVSLAWAITELLAETISCRTLFATHYHELTALSTSFSNIKNFNFAVKEWNDEIIFLRKVVEGGTDRSYGIHVARLAGIPKPALDRAREILSNLEAQAFDLQDRPRIAHRDATPANAPEPTEAGLQLDFFRSPNEDILRDLKRTDLDRLTPLEALQLLSDLQKRIV
ncbi:MAG: DNA mismatch repair protein MutS, partial [Planctomycetes bacterium]|nr:DNA mismatch repair protein MutS [Planctomycetota bacterium]